MQTRNARRADNEHSSVVQNCEGNASTVVAMSPTGKSRGNVTKHLLWELSVRSAAGRRKQRGMPRKLTDNFLKQGG
jgi:hypothetical protein